MRVAGGHYGWRQRVGIAKAATECCGGASRGNRHCPNDAFPMSSGCPRSIRPRHREGIMGAGAKADFDQNLPCIALTCLGQPWPSMFRGQPGGIGKALWGQWRFFLEAFSLPQSALKFIPGRNQISIKTFSGGKLWIYCTGSLSYDVEALGFS